MTTKKRAKRQARRRPRRPGNLKRPTQTRPGPVARPAGTARPEVGTRPPGVAEGARNAQPVPDEAREVGQLFEDALADDHPFLFLATVSSAFAFLDHRTLDDQHRLDLPVLLDALGRSELLGFRALGFGLAKMIGRDHEREAFDKAYVQRKAELPTWLQDLDSTEIVGCWRGYHEDCSDDALGIGIRLTDGEEATLVVITGDYTQEIVEAYVTLTPYAEAALEWTSCGFAAAGLSKISNGTAHAALQAALAASDPTDPDDTSQPAEWAHLRSVMEWVDSLLGAARKQLITQ